MPDDYSDADYRDLPSYDSRALDEAWQSMSNSGSAPNYRCPSDQPGMMCGNCVHRNAQGVCTKYNFACGAECICDSWESRGGVAPPIPVDAPPEPLSMPSPNIPRRDY